MPVLVGTVLRRERETMPDHRLEETFHPFKNCGERNKKVWFKLQEVYEPGVAAK